jgi:agmatinase
MENWAYMVDRNMDPAWEVTDSLEPGTVAVLGMPFDENSSFMPGAALAPARIREALSSGASNLCAESGLDLGTDLRWRDLGDLELTTGRAALGQIESAVASLLDQEVYVLALGGDHAISVPIVRAYAHRFERLNILHLDAHPDLYDEYEGNRFSHACPFARIMEEGLAARLVQVGIRTMNPHQRAQAEKFGVEAIEMRDWRPDLNLEFDGPVYLSLDLDVLDPAFAPGISHYEPGGFSTRQLLQLIQTLSVPLVGADLVEFNPARDPAGITGMVAAKLLKEIVACMLAEYRSAE